MSPSEGRHPWVSSASPTFSTGSRMRSRMCLWNGPDLPSCTRCAASGPTIGFGAHCRQWRHVLVLPA
eukprot:12906872-Prorocentrum_lima.AAC.1